MHMLLRTTIHIRTTTLAVKSRISPRIIPGKLSEIKAPRSIHRDKRPVNTIFTEHDLIGKTIDITAKLSHESMGFRQQAYGLHDIYSLFITVYQPPHQHHLYVLLVSVPPPVDAAIVEEGVVGVVVELPDDRIAVSSEIHILDLVFLRNSIHLLHVHIERLALAPVVTVPLETRVPGPEVQPNDSLARRPAHILLGFLNLPLEVTIEPRHTSADERHSVKQPFVFHTRWQSVIAGFFPRVELATNLCG
mmetsp:Transcript_12957/g.23505  ORF Transcript_12957/g.23505 Transcript_12957/m.23505 type:complete len:248 (+) Transcript_12957:64-807(+)